VKISILQDNPNGWITPFVLSLIAELEKRGYSVRRYNDYHEFENGWVAFFLSCEKIVPERYLKKHQHNIVCHPSDLPNGRGFSPLAWQILEGKSDIPITLFEATHELDAGPYYFKDVIKLQGHELNDHIKKLQGEKTVEMCLRFIDEYDKLKLIKQQGAPSYYARRTKASVKLDIYKSIAEQWALLRTADNDRFPAYFEWGGKKIILKMYEE